MKSVKTVLTILLVLSALLLLPIAWANCADEKAQCRSYCGNNQDCLADCERRC